MKITSLNRRGKKPTTCGSIMDLREYGEHLVEAHLRTYRLFPGWGFSVAAAVSTLILLPTGSIIALTPAALWLLWALGLWVEAFLAAFFPPPKTENEAAYLLHITHEVGQHHILHGTKGRYTCQCWQQVIPPWAELPQEIK